MDKIEVYDNICFNYEGELRVDTVTSIETYETSCEKHVIYMTAAHGPIKKTSVRQKLSPSLKEIHDNQPDRKLDLEKYDKFEEVE